MTGNKQHQADAVLADIAQSIPAIADDAVSLKLLKDGLERRIAGQFGLLIPLALIGWIAIDTPNLRGLGMLIVLQAFAQLAITASSTWLRRGMSGVSLPRFRHALWMLAEASSGAVWAAALALIGPMIGSSDAALTSWITILVTMTVSALLAAPIAGIVFPLFAGFAVTLAAGTLMLERDVSSFSELALLCLTGALFVVAKAVNLQARANCRAEIGVVRLSERLEEELRRTSWLSRHDSLTGLLNRSALQSAIAERGESPTPVILMDIDHFKAINDNFGHMQGDAVIAAVGACISQVLTEVADGALAARWGGEEFIIALPGRSDAQAKDIAETLRKAVARLTHEDWPARLRLTASLGIASGPAASFPSLFKQADRAMYDAKASGRNRVLNAPEEDGKVVKPPRAA